MTDDTTPAGASFEPIIQAARQAVPPHKLQPGWIYTLITADGEHEIHDLTTRQHLAAWRPTPFRKTGCFRFFTPESFSGYVVTQGERDRTSIWADIDQLEMKAVLNGHFNRPNEAYGVFSDDVQEEDHNCAGAGWGDHTALLTLQTTEEWDAWTGFAGKQHPQATFADFVEDHLPDIVEPDAALLLEVAQSITGTTTAKFASRFRLDNGLVNVSYEEEGGLTAGVKGQLAIPQRLKLALSPFRGFDPFAVTARLRVRVDKASLTLGIYLDQLHTVRETAFLRAIEQVQAATQLPVYRGRPASLV